MTVVNLPVNGVRLHAVVAGAGSPIVLLHGWPVTWFHWRHVIAPLARDHLVIAPDLRGLGDSERAADGYDKRTLAEDVVALATELGADRFALVGHDFGGSVGYALAAAYPDKVTHLVIEEEVFPGITVPSSLMHSRYPQWHNGFHKADGVAETLVGGRERDYLEVFWRLTAKPMPPQVIEEYLRTYVTADTLRTGLAYYRTTPRDAELNQRTAQQPLAVPTLAIAGDQAMARAVGECCRQVATNVTEVVLADCGHYPAEEHPKRVAELIADFVRP